MVLNGDGLLLASPIKNMMQNKRIEHGVSYGMAEPETERRNFSPKDISDADLYLLWLRS